MSFTLYSHDLIAHVLVDKNSELYIPKDKIVFGVDGTYTDVTSASPFPVTDTTSQGILTQIDADLVAFRSANHTDLISVTGYLNQIDIDLVALSAKVTDNYGAASGAVRTASQIGNSTGQADFNNGISTAQTLRTATNLSDGSGNKIASALDVSGARNLLVSVTHNIFVSINNSTTANLGVGATFLGIADNNLNATTIQVNVKCDQAITISVEQSNDSIHWDFVDTYLLNANQDDSRLFLAAGSYARVRVVNSGTATTTYLNLQTILVPIQSVLPRDLTNFGNLKTSIEEVSPFLGNILTADKDIYGAAVQNTRIKRLSGDFSLSLSSNDVSTSITGTGTVTQSNSMAVLSTGTGVTSSASLFSNQANKHYTGRESFVQFGCNFTTPTNANSEQRVGIYDSSNGFFVGYHGLTFGVTYRSNGTNTFIPRTSFNEDLIDGNPNSLYTRNDLPEPIDVTKLNRYRIRFGIGATIVLFEVLSPDDAWVVFHAIESVNVLTVPIILNGTLPVTCEVIKTSSDATNLVVNLPGFDAGTTENPNAYGVEDINSRKYVTANVVSQTTSQAVYTVSTGRTLRVTTLDISCGNSSTSTAGQLNIRDGAAGTILFPLSIPASTNQSSAGGNKTLTFSVPLRFTSSVYAQVVSGTLTFSIMFVGYEAES